MNRAELPPRSKPKLPLRKRLLFIGMAVLVSLSALAVLGEVAARWYFNRDGATTTSLVRDPVLGFKLNPALEWVNSLGIAHAEIPAEKPADLYRVLVLGDSVTFPPDGWVASLRKLVGASTEAEVEIINAAIHGYTTYQERVLLERDLLATRPDLVVLQYCVNDNFKFLHHITEDGQRLMTLEARNFLFPDGEGWIDAIAEHSYLAYAIRRVLLRLRTPTRSTYPWENSMARAAWSDSTWADQEDNLRAMADRVRSISGRFVVMAVPHEMQLDAKLLAQDASYTLKPQRKLAAICKKIEVPFLDIQKSFVTNRDKTLYTDGIHLTDVGHRITGRAVAGFLQGLGLIP